MLFLNFNCIFLSIEPDFDFIYLLIIFLLIISVGVLFFAIKRLIDSLKFYKLKKLLISEYNLNKVINSQDLIANYKSIFGLRDLKENDFTKLVPYVNNTITKINKQKAFPDDEEGLIQSLKNSRDLLNSEFPYGFLPENLSSILIELIDDENRKNDPNFTDKINDLAYIIFNNIKHEKRYRLVMGVSIFILIIGFILTLYYIFEIL
ncbi:hypothetical protein ACFLSQ_11050 [Bacteroidota bacterium]